MDWLFGFVNSIGGFLSDTLALLGSLVAWLLSAVAFLANAVEALGTYITRVIDALVKFLQNLWQNFIKNIIQRLLTWVQQAQAWLEAKLRPIINFLKQLRAWWDRYYRLHILPIINLIQRIRRFLLILRLLHIHFADALDKWLQKYEAALNKINLAVHGALTQLISWATLAANPVGLGRMVLVSVTGRRTVAAIVRAVTSLPIGHFFPYNGPGALPFERQPLTANDYTSEVTNPPASAILAPLMSFLGTSEFDDQVGVTDTDIDAVEATPWGPQFIQSLLASEQFVAGYDADPLSIRVMLEDQVGVLYDTGQTLAASLATMWR